jgi:hypothetical protein
VKLVATKDPELTGKIIKATNRQTPVQIEAFETLRDFHKNLEAMYESYDSDFRLYYERRSKQYDSKSINKNKIVSFSAQISAYLAMFLGEPQSTHRYYGEILEANKKRIFKEDDILDQYCISAMYLYYVEKWLYDNGYYREYKQYKYHLILLARQIIDISPLPRTNSNQMKKLCDKLYDTIKNKEKIDYVFRQALKIIEQNRKKSISSKQDDRQLARTREFTRDILESVGVSANEINRNNQIRPIHKGEIFECIVTGYNRSFVYLEIIDHKELASVHIREVTDGFIDDSGSVIKRNDMVKAVILDEKPNIQFGYEMSIRQAKK